MAEITAVRQALAGFLGEERFRKFVKQGFQRGRLRYWQEQEWASFTAAHPEFSVSMDLLATAIRICELHGRELMPDKVKVFHGNIDFADDYVKACNQLFPHVANALCTQGAPFEGDFAEVWYCPDCRRAHAEWMARR